MDTMTQHDAEQRAYRNRVIRDAACTLKSCGAPVGEPCRWPHGKSRPPHNRRQLLAFRTVRCPRPSCQAAPGEMCISQGRVHSWVCHVERGTAYERVSFGSRRL